jgi:polyisoprenoid-binding protein YceI
MAPAPMNTLLAGVVALAAAAAPAHAAPRSYAFDPERSFVHLEVLHFGTSTIHIRLGPVAGVVTLDAEAGRGELGLRIETQKASTGIPVFDARLKEKDLLASAEFPEAYFVASRFRFEGTRLAEVRGEFTMRGTSQPLSLRTLRYGCRSDPGDPRIEVCGGDFEGELLRSSVGATFGLPLIGDRVRIVVQVEGRTAPTPR